MMEDENLSPEPVAEPDVYAREERCEKAIRTVRKAVFIRLFMAVLLIAAPIYFRLDIWATGLLIFTVIINLAGMMPLVKEWKDRKSELKKLLEMEEN